MNKIKVIEFITSMGEGGAQSLVKDYALFLDKSKFDVVIVDIYPSFDSGPGQVILKQQIPYISIYPSDSKMWHLVNKIVGKYIVSLKLNRIIKKCEPLVIHSHLRVLKYLTGIQLDGIKLFYTCHSLPMKTFQSTLSTEFKAAQKLIKENNLQLIALHADMQDELNKLFCVDNTQIVYNGTDIQRFVNVDESKESIRESLHISSDAFVVGHVGRFMDAKNHEFIVKVFSEVCKRDKKAILLLVGTGPLKNRIISLIKELMLVKNVIMLENRSDVERILKAMDVFLFPSIYEGFPISLIEAQAAGLHCVVSNNVTSDAFVSPDLINIDLKKPLGEWVDSVMSIKQIGQFRRDIYDYEMKKTIQKLERLYSE